MTEQTWPKGWAKGAGVSHNVLDHTRASAVDAHVGPPRLFVQDSDFTLYVGDVRDCLRELPDQSVHTVVTSPPYWGLRDYGTGAWEGGNPDCDHKRPDGQGKARPDLPNPPAGWAERDATVRTAFNVCPCGATRVDQQLGLEPTPEAFVTAMVDVFREVRRVLREDGTLWLNLGDSYVSTAPGTADKPQRMNGMADDHRGSQRTRPKVDTLKPKDLVGIPWRVAFALQQPYYTGRIKDERDRLWLAAMIDAEGCIYIHKRKVGQSNGQGYERKSDSYGSGLEVSNTSREIVERVLAIVGKGSISTSTRGRNQPLYRWNLRSNECRDVLCEVYPHLVAKQQQARLAIFCPSSGADAEKAHASLIALHNGEPATIDFTAPSSLFEPGWYLRSDVIWSKSNPMPESVTDRPTKAHEYVFLLTKQPRYYFDAEAVREAWARPDGQRTTSHYNTAERYGAGNGGNAGLDGLAARMRTAVRPPQDETLDGSDGEAPRGPDGRRATVVKGGDNSLQHRDGERWPNAGRNIRSVWEIATQPYPDAHFATFPEALPERCIKAGSSERGCCPECGAPWVRRVIRAGSTRNGPTASGWRESGERASQDAVARVGEVGVETVGWRVSCDCHKARGDFDRFRREPKAPVPCTVLDPFMGSGTTALVARRLGRKSIGVELNPEYAALCARRLQQLSLLA